MKKLITAVLISVSLVATSVSAHAAVKKPSPAAKEGTAAHESAESTETQKTEAVASSKTKHVATSTKHVSAKPSAKSTAKPSATPSKKK